MLMLLTVKWRGSERAEEREVVRNDPSQMGSVYLSAVPAHCCIEACCLSCGPMDLRLEADSEARAGCN